jgi:hypothetical protein
MDDDEPQAEKPYPVAKAKLSKTPSWIMLGFVLGALFVVALPPLRKPPTEALTLRVVENRPAQPREPQPLTTIEDVFATWGEQAVWSDNVTEVAMWNIKEKAFCDFYEVRRVGEVMYFRTIPRLTRRIIARGKLVTECPLQFTETEEQYREWQTYGRSERPVERVAQPKPRIATPSAEAPPVERSVKIVAPPIPPPEFPPSPAKR